MLYSPHEVRRMKYIYQQKDWPNFQWDNTKLVNLLASVHIHQGYLFGRMEALGFNLRDEAMLRTLTLDVVKNSEIENEILDSDQVRSSVARRLGMNIAALVPSDKRIDGVVEMMLNATQHFDKPLTKERLQEWHTLLFPHPESGFYKIIAGDWRNDHHGPMQVTSGAIGRERVHFQAPDAKQIEKEMKKFLAWFNAKQNIDPVIKAGIAHLWFVTIHPFEDGNGRIARTIADLQLARADDNSQRFYSMSAQIRQERNAYYKILEETQKGNLDITHWLEWFLTCLDHSLTSTDKVLADVVTRTRFWENNKAESLNPRQRDMLNKLLDNFYGKLTTTKWAKLTKCSQDTALRDIQDLINRGILIKDDAGGRSTSYSLPKNT